ncbi:MAG TPA: protein kinase, partial [Gemmatimonadales bacterium]|nr:protein kinase [Gemmatimonadales bacterium]
MSGLIERLRAALNDRYRIERELGQGGMATVYLAHDTRHDRKVAVKVLRPELAAVIGAERFVVEIKTTAQLQHPHILPLFDSGSVTVDGRWSLVDGQGAATPLTNEGTNDQRPAAFLYYVMPYVEGETLRDTLNRETQLGVDEAVKIAVAVADALDYAHRHG